MNTVTNNRTPFPGHGMLNGPEQYTLGVVGSREIRLQSKEDYILWHNILMAQRQDKTWKSPEAVRVFVNFGKWVALCHWCNGGMLTRPDWKLACCSECGAFFEDEQLIFPGDPRILEALLARPARDTQHWDYLQTADDLIRENKEELNL